jgi:hypothetical protein
LNPAAPQDLVASRQRIKRAGAEVAADPPELARFFGSPSDAYAALGTGAILQTLVQMFSGNQFAVTGAAARASAGIRTE